MALCPDGPACSDCKTSIAKLLAKQSSAPAGFCLNSTVLSKREVCLDAMPTVLKRLATCNRLGNTFFADFSSRHATGKNFTRFCNQTGGQLTSRCCACCCARCAVLAKAVIMLWLEVDMLVVMVAAAARRAWLAAWLCC